MFWNMLAHDSRCRDSKFFQPPCSLAATTGLDQEGISGKFSHRLAFASSLILLPILFQVPPLQPRQLQLLRMPSPLLGGQLHRLLCTFLSQQTLTKHLLPWCPRTKKPRRCQTPQWEIQGLQASEIPVAQELQGMLSAADSFATAYFLVEPLPEPVSGISRNGSSPVWSKHPYGSAEGHTHPPSLHLIAGAVQTWRRLAWSSERDVLRDSLQT